MENVFYKPQEFWYLAGLAREPQLHAQRKGHPAQVICICFTLETGLEVGDFVFSLGSS